MVDEDKPKGRGLFGVRRSRRVTAQAAAPTPVTADSTQPEQPAQTEAQPALAELNDALDSIRSVEKTVEDPAAKPAESAPAESSAQPALDIPADEEQTAEQTTGPAADAPAPEVVETPAEAIVADETVGEQAPADAATAPAAEEEPAASGPQSLFSGEITSTSLLFRAPDLPTWVPPERGTRAEQPGQGASQGDIEPGSATGRRRSRRRGGEDVTDEPREQRQPQQRQPKQPPAPITEPQRIKGSTRLEAKKQRRRDGRDAGRRRSVITEAEFLARRESVDRAMVVREANNRTQIAVLEDGVLVEHYVARAQDSGLIGNVYLGRVQNVLPSMEAAFVDIGRGRNAVLYSGEVDWDAVQQDPELKNQPRRIELALKPGDRVLVQVTKDPVGHKGARLTSQISLPGRYLVYVPGGSMNGISRKLPDTERARLKKILKEVLPDDAGVIVRTAAEGATEEQLTIDVQRLTQQWAEIERAVEIGQAPALLHSEPDLLIKIVRDVFNEDFQRMVIAGDDAQQAIDKYLGSVAPDLVDRVERYEGDKDAFDQFRVTEQIEKALDRKVWLPSGGSLIIDRTEAMTVVDVNTGKFVGSGGNLEETVTKNNLEAAEEVVRQLRLRDIGGIIVIDFIDMVLESNRDLVLRRLVECLSRDRTKHQVAEVTSLGLVQMTRKKLGLGLLETFSEPCEHCAGRGVVVFHDPVTKHRGNGGGSNGGNGGQNGGGEGGSGRSRRGRGGSGSNGGNGGQNGGGSNGAGNGGNGGSNANGGKPNGGTHAITDDVRNALGLIAKSSAAAHAGDEHAEGAPAEQAVAAAATARDGGASEKAEAQPKAELAEQAAGAAAEAAVKILDLPVVKAKRNARRISTKDAEDILDSVLDALPEPKLPGEGRATRGSRRAGSAGAVVTPPSE
ncbi:Rne/Rng family ribonuclease [Schumannella soli]|nr:Rne/Rng family ribonuclease [Schumannella soli]